MARSGGARVDAWVQAGVIDSATADRIRAFEAERRDRGGWRWPVWLALSFGALMIAAGVLLFVSANWDQMSPAARFALVLAMVGVFHVAGAVSAGRFEPLATTLHGLGTVALGAGILLAAQIFNLNEHWPSGVLLWAVGAWLGWCLRRDWPQLALAAILTPAWLVSEWGFRTSFSSASSAGVFLIALSYITLERGRLTPPNARALTWIGAIAVLPAGIGLASYAGSAFSLTTPSWVQHPSTVSRALAWTIAIGGPLAVAVFFRRRFAWLNALAAVWVIVLVNLHLVGDRLWIYPWMGLGAASVAAWGVREARTLLVNMGTAAFAIVVLAFYNDTVMGKMGRSASLIVLGVLCLGGGYLLERARRKMLATLQGGRS